MNDELLHELRSGDVKLQVYLSPLGTISYWLTVGVAGVRIKQDQLETIFEGFLAMDEFVEDYMSNEHDEIELGDTGLIPMEDGWFKNIKTKETIAPDGTTYNEQGDVVEPK